MQKRTYLTASVLAVVVLMLAGPAAQACETYPTPLDGFQAATRGNTSSQIDFTGELGDYGLIFEDAKARDCDGGSWLSSTNPPTKHGAYEALLTKINTTVGPYNNQTHVDFQGNTVYPYRGWLEGGFVTLTFSSALMIGGHGDMDTTLDTALQKVEQWYDAPIGGPGRCGFYQPSGWANGGDTCMEEHVTAASAYAWIAAYESKRRGYWAGQPFAVKANQQIAAAFSTYDSICISDPTGTMDVNSRGPCNVNIAPTDPNYVSTLQSYLVPDPFTGRTRADVLSFNRNQNVLYGFGQFGQISSALIALSEGGYDRNSNSGQPSLSQGEQLIAIALLDEAQRKSDSAGNSFSGNRCAQATISGSSVVRQDIYNCSDTPPKAFAYNTRSWATGWSSFYQNWVTMYSPHSSVVDHTIVNGVNSYTTVNPAYQFDSFDDTLFGRNVHFGSNGSLNWGRYTIYKNLGWTWNTIDSNRDVNNTWNATSEKRPRLWAYNDDYNPKGYLDSIDSNGVAYGWTCDQDQPNTSNFIDFYVDGGGLGTLVMRVQANGGSEQAVANECGGGYAHRFAAQLPAWTKGHYVYAWGLDATWRGVNVLNGWQCPATAPACVW
jgi:hypothetical protein